MLQIYVLVVAINIIMGIIMLFEGKLEEDASSATVSFIHNSTFTLTLSIFAGIIALSSFVSPYGEATGKDMPFSMLPVLGDFFASVATFAGFLGFLTRYIKVNHPSLYAGYSFFELIEMNERSIAIFCLVMATLHFLFPKALFI